MKERTWWAEVSELYGQITSSEAAAQARIVTSRSHLGADKAIREARETIERAVTLPNLLPLLEELKAQWRYTNFGYQFKFPDGVLLCWWPRTGSLLWQGTIPEGLNKLLSHQGKVLDALESYRAAAAEYRAPAPEQEIPVASAPPTPVCIVCGNQATANHCEACEHDEKDLCASCWTFAHWCREERRAS